MIPRATDPGMDKVFDQFALSWGAEGQRLFLLKRFRHLARTKLMGKAHLLRSNP